ncbi:polysaccharide deacetylase family protein [Conexibacter sp. DBS9H8]|uniref:polysaccharide deacetylase family protein n=1 Tax=Conexibacter sp. DBS9H8 TaxID=2937801 RepID=UPI00200DA4AC|nr:polysaccharide deacetylase family protein [Conexibacter sp. DBS9H8]
MDGVALTFDDGPDAHWTRALLDVLAALKVTGTFFVIAPRAAAHPGLLARMAADGHTVGLHCDEHVRHRERDADWLRRDTATALGRLKAIGVRPKLWRTPWGETAPWTEPVAVEHGLEIVGWTVDSHDWRGDSAERMFAATRDEITAGAVVLAHDGIGPGARREGAGETLRYVASVATHARARGLTLEALT